VARRLAADGFDVAVHYHGDAAGARRTAAAVHKVGRNAIVLAADLGEEAQVTGLSRDVAKAFPRLDCIVHNAGVYDRRSFADMDGAAWRRTLDVDLTAPALLTWSLLPRLAAGASLVFVSSIVAARGSRHGAHYAAAKAGLLGLTRSLALELAPRIRVNAVAPGYIDTALLAGDNPAKRRARAAEVPLGRVGRPEDVAGTVSFLAGPDSRYLTGQVLHVNGGLWMG
jgi:NAD(P)-dependent dehydrogenase (short-subunit alcohol dehydrogenase family)